jgi:acyl-[acyl-carrier-protein]-phospholipid O-acyltransferase/long-chain-fatty-acid--[acyl-carrier-protein] ligase
MQATDNSPKWKRGFWSVWATQFQESFSDLAYRWLVISFVTHRAVSTAQVDVQKAIAGVLFAAPFVLFSPAGGYLADRFSKRAVILGTKFGEMLVMTVAFAGLALGNLPIMLGALFLRGIQSSCYSPSKFGMLPEILPDDRLSWGNGIVELGSFVAVIAGTVAGTSLYDWYAGRLSFAGAILFGVTLIGLAVSNTLPRVQAAGSTKPFRVNPFGELAEQWKAMRKDRTLVLAVLGSTYFYMLAMLLQTAVEDWGNLIFKASQSQTGYLQAAIGIGIGIGSFAAGYASGGKIEYGLIPLGSAGLAVFATVISWHAWSFNSLALLLGVLGFAGGFFAVPVMAIIQHRPDAEKKGAVIAASNQLNFIGIGFASLLYWLFTGPLHLPVPAVFLAGAVLTLAATIYAVRLMPDSVLRLLLWILVHSVYRMRIQGRENLPATGGALIVANHLSLVDALLLMCSTDRQVRFLMFRDIYERPFIKPFAKLAGAIPISSAVHPREMIRSLRDASDWIQSGHVACIFAEGEMTRTGQLLPFKRGLERIMKGVEAPIIPVNLDGVWGSIFSFERGRYVWKLPHRIPYPVTITYGKPMPASSTAMDIRAVVQQLGSDAFLLRKKRTPTIARAFVRTARRHPFRFAMVDANTPKGLRFGSVLTRSIFLAGRLQKEWQGQSMVGILLPPTVPAALVNYAALLMGKVPVNLNYTLSAEGIASCIQQCEIQTVLTSRAFLEKVPLQLPGRVLFLEDLAKDPQRSEQLRALAIAALPAGLLARALGAQTGSTPDDLATVIFSSGSTGDPKGVMLTHWNVISNVEQLGQVVALDHNDKLLGVLPFFHSFGFTATFVLPMVLGVGAIYHHHPLDAQVIGALVRRYAVTFVLATPTFLQAYMRRCEPEMFGSVRLVMVGAEKLQERTAVAFEDRFGVRPLEAYGCTECAPAVTVNMRDYRAAGFRQVAAKRGKIGHPLPGVSVRIVNPDTMQDLPAGEAGLLLVRGPNVMKGYLNQPEKTAAVMHDGWYITGDIAAIDEDGFIEITDRLSRFSKIGGEMVPHIKVEDKLHEIAGASGQVFAVTAAPDEKRGERLLVLHTLPEKELKECLAKLPQSGLPNLWLPKPDAFLKVDELPYLGSGKLDLRRIRDLAISMDKPERSAAATSS